MACAGTIALSAQLNEALDALYAARIPAAWVKRSWQVRAVPLRHTGGCVHDIRG